jgi:hypothetical protein
VLDALLLFVGGCIAENVKKTTSSSRSVRMWNRHECQRAMKRTYSAKRILPVHALLLFVGGCIAENEIHIFECLLKNS